MRYILYSHAVPCFSLLKSLTSRESSEKEDALRDACKKGAVVYVTSLLQQQGANAEAADTSTGHTPLHAAAAQGHASIVQVLLQHGVSRDPRDKRGNTPLMLAARYNHTEALRLLLAHGAHKDARNHEQKTALHYAAKYGQLASVRLLIDAGADAAAKQSKGKTPAVRARVLHVRFPFSILFSLFFVSLSPSLVSLFSVSSHFCLFSLLSPLPPFFSFLFSLSLYLSFSFSHACAHAGGCTCE